MRVDTRSCVLALLLIFGLAFTSGCSNSFAPSADPEAASVGNIHGNVHGGQQPIVGSHVYLYAAGTGGYGGSGLAASTANASSSLLNASVLTNSPLNSGIDGNGNYYVTTDGSGNFSITGDYACTAGTQVYIYAVGGNPGLPVTGSDPTPANSAAGLMAVLGQCPAGQSLAATVPYVFVDEVSTVAAAYSMAGFASDATHVGSSGTALAQTGIANAFANAANLANVATGAALADTPAGNGVVPQATIDTLANILAACINSAGPSSTGCAALLSTATSDGTVDGTQPTDTATAAINIAHHPAANVAALYGLATASAPFSPALTAQPNDFTIGLQFTGGGLDEPGGIAIDGSGNAWVVDYALDGEEIYTGGVTEFSSSGSVLSGATGFDGGNLHAAFGIAIDSYGNAWVVNDYEPYGVNKFSNSGSLLSGSGYTGGGLTSSYSIAIDGSGNAWIADSAGEGYYPGGVTEFSNSGSALSGTKGYIGGGLDAPNSIAIDGSGNAWVANPEVNDVTELSNSGSVVSGSPFFGGGLNYPYAIAIDGSGNVWTANQGNSVTELSNSGSALSGTTGFTGGGLNLPYAVAIDGSGNAWIANLANSVTELSNSGVALSGATGFTGGGLDDSGAIAIDGSGNAWIANYASNSVTELIGAATPVITPICAGLPAVPTLNGTSNLGTRP